MIRFLLKHFSILGYLVFLLIGWSAHAQCDINDFTLTPQNGVCVQDGSIDITIPGATSCGASAVATLSQGGTDITFTILSNTGDGTFPNLAPGTYEVRISDGVDTTAPQSVVITSSYTPMTLATSVSNTSCSGGDANNPADGSVTISVTGGTGPYLYELVLGGTAQQTFGPTPATGHTFTNVAADTYEVRVTDQDPSCTSQNVQSTTVVETVSTPLELFFERSRPANSPDCGQVIHRIAVRNGNQNNTITATALLNGVAINAIPAGVTTFDFEGLTPGDVLSDIEVTDGCNVVAVPDLTVPDIPLNPDYLFVEEIVSRDNNCNEQIFFRVGGVIQPSSLTGGRSAFNFATTNNLTLEIEDPINSNNWVILADLNNRISLSNSGAELLAGQGLNRRYRITATDFCHTVERIIEPMVTFSNPLDQVRLVETDSKLEGTSGFRFVKTNPSNPAGTVEFSSNDIFNFPINVTVNQLSGATTITPSQPYSLGGTYTYGFPFTAEFINSTGLSGTWSGRPQIGNLPLGEYQVTLTDACGDSRVQTITLTEPAIYNPSITVNQGCANSDIIYDIAGTGFTNHSVTELYENNGGTLGTLIRGESENPNNTNQGQFGTIPPGEYIVRFSEVLWRPSIPSVSYEDESFYDAAEQEFRAFSEYQTTLTVPPFQQVAFNTLSVFCDNNDPNSGILAVTAMGQPVGSITYSIWENTLDPDTDTPTQTFTTTDLTETEHVFQNLAEGTYAVRVITDCGFTEQTVELLRAPIAFPDPVASPEEVCTGDNSNLSIALPGSIFDIEWFDSGNNSIGTGNTVTVSPTATETFTVNYQLSTALGCTTATSGTGSIEVTVSNPYPGLVVTGNGPVCEGEDATITIAAAETDVTYELLQGGNPLAPAVTGVGAAADLILTVPAAQLTAGTTTYSIAATSASGICTETLVQTVDITVDTAPDGNLTVTGNGPVCEGADATITITAAETGVTYEVLQGGNPLAPAVSGTGAAADLTLTVPAAQLTAGTTTYSIAATSASGACTETLVQTIDIVVNDPLTQTGNATASCDTSGTFYTLEVELDGTAPFLATGTGAPGTFNGNIWTSDNIATGTDYDVDFTDANGCNTLTVADTAPTCCTFEVTCPTFPATTVACYTDLAGAPYQATYTEAEFEALGNGDGSIGDSPCGTIEITATNSPDTGNCNQTVTRTYLVREFTDANGNGTFDTGDTELNSTSCAQTITVNDTTAPTLIGVLPQDITLECDRIPAASTLVALDNCPFVPVSTLDWSDHITPFGWAPGATSGSFNVDGVPINVSIADPANAIGFPLPAVNDFYQGDQSAQDETLIIAAAIQTLGTTNSITTTIDLGTVGTGVSTLNFKLFDVDGNTNPALFRNEKYTIQGFLNGTPVNPAISSGGAQQVTGNMVQGIDGASATGPDAAQEVVSVFFAGNVDRVEIVFEIADEPGTQTGTNSTPGFGIHDINFTTSPTTNVPVVFNETLAPGACPGQYTLTRTWTATDACSNGVSHSQTITVNDTTDPTASDPAPITVACTADIPAPDTTVVTDAMDNCGTPTVAFVSDVSDNNSCAETITRTYSVSDGCGNSINVTQTITVDDTINPTASDPAPITVACAADVPTPDITVVTDAADNCGAPTVAFVGDVSDGNSCAEVITRTYSVTDACGNSINVAQTITVDDTIDPTASNPAPISVACAADVPAPDITVVTDAADNCSNVTVAFVGDISNTNGCSETITRTYSVTDACGNSINVAQTITVDDTIDPTASDPAPITVACAADVPAPDINVVTDAADNCGTPTVAFVGDVSDNGSCTETITRTYSVTDACGNGINVAQTITVSDTVPPTASDPAPITVECTEDIPVPDTNVVADAADNCGSVTVAFVGDVSDNGSCTETITRTYSVTDGCGNAINVSRTITVSDTTAPVLAGPLPTDIAQGCDTALPAAAVLTATDGCHNAEVAFTETVLEGACPGDYTVLRTWTAEDACGNATSHTQAITVADTAPPVFVETLPQDGSVACGAVPEAVELTATDTCGDVAVTFDETRTEGSCSSRYTLIRTWTAEDACGNATSHTQALEVACGLEVFNAVSANGDGTNEVFRIEGIDCYPDNTVMIFNRWGVKVFEVDGYDNGRNAFRGLSDGRATVARGERLPTGNYFYILQYRVTGDGDPVQRSGYLYLASANQ